MDEKIIREKLLLLRKRLKGEYKKLQKKMQKQESEHEIAGNWLWYQQIGDSLLADPDSIVKGTTDTEILNSHTHQTEKVKLNPKYDAVRNAKIFYRKAKKGKRGVEICEEQLGSTQNELNRVTDLIEKCNECLQMDDENEEFQAAFEDLESTIEKNSSIEGSKDSKKDTSTLKIPYRLYTVDGWQVYIGKNNAQNDELSIRFAKPRDIWLHVAAHSGSHCVIKREKNQEWPPKQVIEKVSALAVWFSKAKHTSYAEVHVTEARFVRKPRKSPPGEVVIQQYKTVRVAPKSPQELFKE